MSAFERFFFVWDLEKGVRVRFLGCPLLRVFFIQEKAVSAGTFKLCPLLGGVRFLGYPLPGMSASGRFDCNYKVGLLRAEEILLFFIFVYNSLPLTQGAEGTSVCLY